MKTYFSLILAIWLLMSCQDSSEQLSVDPIQNFTFEVAQYADTLPTTQSRAVGREITQLVAGIYNAEGMLLSNLIMTQSPDLTHLSVEGLGDGDYTAVFIGVGEQRSTEKPVLVLPDRIEKAWLWTDAEGVAHNNEYLYASSLFTIKNNKGVSANVSLKRAVGRIDIEPNFTDEQWTKGTIQSILLTFDDASVYTMQRANGMYDGLSGVSPTEVVKNFSIYTLPTAGSTKKHGSLTITGIQGDATTYKIFYEFDLIVEANKRAVIRPSYALNNDLFGTVRVYDTDRNAKNSRLILQDFTDGTQHYMEVASHTFKMNGLLQLSFNNQTMIAKLYSHIGVKNVTIYVRRPNDIEFFEVAWFESMQALEERKITLSSSPHNRLYRTESGGTVFIDRMTSDLEYKYVSNDAHMKKLASIKWPCRIHFISPGNDTLRTDRDNLPLRAVHAREAIALWTNVGFMYSHPDWERLMLAEESRNPFLEYGNAVSIKNVFIPQIQNRADNNYIILNVLNTADDSAGLSTVGVGNKLGLRQEIIVTTHYMNQDNYYGVSAYAPHEYGHTLGYGHEGDFTYGKCTTMNVLFFRTYKNELPYPTSLLLNSTSNKNLYTNLRPWP